MKVAQEERQKVIEKKNEAIAMARQYSLMNKSVKRFQYVIIAGNNGNVVRRCMQLREERWEETNSFDKLYNFKWQPISRGIQFEVVNQFGTR